MKKIALLAMAAVFSGAALAAPPAVPTKSYTATVLSVSYHFCIITVAGTQNTLPIAEGNCTGAPADLPVRAEYDYLEGQVQINGRVYRYQFDNLPHPICYQSAPTTRCLGNPPTPSATANYGSFGFLVGKRGLLRTVLENLATTKGKISFRVVQSAISDPSLATQLDASNVRFLDDGVGDRFLAVVNASGADANWDESHFPDFAK